MAEIPAIKRRLVQQGVDVIDVGAGDADFAPPEVAVEALAHAIRDPAMSRYAFQLGLPVFREAAAAYMKRRFGVRFDPFTELHPLLGSKEGIAHLAMALLDPGDVALVPEPGYAVYEGGTVLAGAEPYRYALTPRTGFLLGLDEVAAAGAREELRGHGGVSRGPGRRGGGAAAGGGAGAGLRRALSRAARCDAARAPRPGVRARDARGDDVRVGAAPRGRRLRGVRAPRAHGGGSGDARRERIRGGRRGVFPHRAHGRHTAAGRGGRAVGKGARRCLRSGDPRASSGGSPGSSAPGCTWRSSSWRSAARGGSTDRRG